MCSRRDPLDRSAVHTQDIRCSTTTTQCSLISVFSQIICGLRKRVYLSSASQMRCQQEQKGIQIKPGLRSTWIMAPSEAHLSRFNRCCCDDEERKKHRIAEFPSSPRDRDQGLRRCSPVTCWFSLMHENNIYMVDIQEYRALYTKAD